MGSIAAFGRVGLQRARSLPVREGLARRQKKTRRSGSFFSVQNHPDILSVALHAMADHSLISEALPVLQLMDPIYR
ncbi:hypothetical protein ACIPL1_10485 [Pseudomonas sp. NPDC090202]|uniref:hypothetical protein n=1 Tax=unclassified Pseudomonas TaxID=196821 RepID=UPI0037FD6A65